MVKTFLVAIIFSLFLIGAARAEFSRDYYRAALSGDLSKVEADLAVQIDGDKDADLYAKFKARFIERTDGLDLDAISDPLVRRTADLYQNYWRDALLAPSNREALEERFEQDLLSLLNNFGIETPDENPDTLGLLKTAIEDRGFELILGRTLPLLEFMVWRENKRQVFEVELTDQTQQVTVYFMSGFISRGWAHYATFGRSSTGGWATADGLYAIEDSYDLASEKFKVSYLQHEGRHFADYALFPKLEGADLEYRAKLTELIYADESLYDLLGHFTGNAARIENAPHSLANWHVINDLAATLLGGKWPETGEAWQDIPKTDIHEAARALLEAHTRALEKEGAKETTGLIRP